MVLTIKQENPEGSRGTWSDPAHHPDFHAIAQVTDAHSKGCDSNEGPAHDVVPALGNVRCVVW